MTIAAIYARKSTDESDRDPENKSVTRQIERARAYAKKHGWTVADVHVYVDDGISGADFENRPGFTALLAALPKRQKVPPFGVLIMSEPSRFGRDAQRVPYHLAHIHDAGVRVFYYLDDREEKLDSTMERIYSNVRALMDEDERKVAGQRSRDALARKAAKGFSAGGACYGYDNVKVYPKGSEVKSHTDYAINKAEADVVRRIYKMAADGYGHVTIAKTLNGEPRYARESRRYFNGARPAPPRTGTGSWAPSSVHGILRRERYTGVIAWGAKKNGYRHGARVRTRQPAVAVQRVQRDDLRIIPPDLEAAVRARLAATQKVYLKDTAGKVWGRPGLGVESKYLLTGFGQCVCGHNITKLGGRWASPGKRAVRHYYGCSYHATRGRTICGNDVLVPMDRADALIIEQIGQLLTPAAADYTIDRALQLLAEQRRRGRADHRDGPKRLDAEARRLRQEIDRLVRAIAGGDAPASVVQAIRDAEMRLKQIEAEREALAPVDLPTEFEERQARRNARERIGRLDDLLRGDVAMARQTLRKIIAGRIEFIPRAHDGQRGYNLRWAVATSALMGGEISSWCREGESNPHGVATAGF